MEFSADQCSCTCENKARAAWEAERVSYEERLALQDKRLETVLREIQSPVAALETVLSLLERAVATTEGISLSPTPQSPRYDDSTRGGCSSTGALRRGTSGDTGASGSSDGSRFGGLHNSDDAGASVDDEAEVPLPELVGRASAAIELLTTMVDKGLRSSKLKAGDELRPKSTPFDLSELLDKVASVARDHAGAKKIEVKTRVALNISPTVYCACDWLFMILSSLAFDATKRTVVGGSVTISAKRVGDSRVKIKVSDPDGGVTEQGLFSARHSRGSSLKQEYPGLQHARELTNLIGGDIGYQRTLPHGGAFYIEVPMRMLPQASSAELAPSSAGGLKRGKRVSFTQTVSPTPTTAVAIAPAPATSMTTVRSSSDFGSTRSSVSDTGEMDWCVTTSPVLVDGSDFVMEAVSEMVEQCLGLRPVCLSSGEEAVAHMTADKTASKAPHDLLLVDFGLHGDPNAFGMTRAIRAWERRRAVSYADRVRIVGLTDDVPSLDGRRKAFSAGMDNVVSKTFFELAKLFPKREHAPMRNAPTGLAQSDDEVAQAFAEFAERPPEPSLRKPCFFDFRGLKHQIAPRA
uniref:Response regulatory domain-containing protein n=2 Tax=Chrysotila carterae TaxID=13221 RepID=A0A7S4BQH5_CHRCT